MDFDERTTFNRGMNWAAGAGMIQSCVWRETLNSNNSVCARSFQIHVPKVPGDTVGRG